MICDLNCGWLGIAVRTPLFAGDSWPGGRLESTGTDEVKDGSPEGDGTLEEAARREREYLKERLRGELGREPTEAELNEWLRRHTEGH